MKQLLLAILIAIVGLISSPAQAQIPKVILKDISGQSISTDTLANEDRPFVISFFASWCKPCNRELDNISDVYEDWQTETGVRLYAVSIDEGQNSMKVKPFVDAHGWTFDILLDPNSDFRRALGISMIPHTLIFSGDGKLISSKSGYQDGAEEHTINTIRQLLNTRHDCDSTQIEPK